MGKCILARMQTTYRASGGNIHEYNQEQHIYMRRSIQQSNWMELGPPGMAQRGASGLPVLLTGPITSALQFRMVDGLCLYTIDWEHSHRYPIQILLKIIVGERSAINSILQEEQTDFSSVQYVAS